MISYLQIVENTKILNVQLFPNWTKSRAKLMHFLLSEEANLELYSEKLFDKLICMTWESRSKVKEVYWWAKFRLS